MPLPKTRAWGKRESGSWTSCGRPTYGAGACAMSAGHWTSDPRYSRSWWLSQLRLLSAHGASHGVACSASPATLKANKTLVTLSLPVTALIRETDSSEVRKRLSAKALQCCRRREDGSCQSGLQNGGVAIAEFWLIVSAAHRAVTWVVSITASPSCLKCLDPGAASSPSRQLQY